jgi:hypothetical protein
MMHGDAGRRGWGEATFKDPRLLTPTKFDTAQRAYEYRVNPTFGRSSTQLGAVPSPARLSLAIRLALGRSADEQRLAAFVHEPHPEGDSVALSRRLASTFGRATYNGVFLLLSDRTVELSPALRATLARQQGVHQLRCDSLWRSAAHAVATTRGAAAYPDLLVAVGRAQEGELTSLEALLRSVGAMDEMKEMRLSPRLRHFLDPKMVERARIDLERQRRGL